MSNNKYRLLDIATFITLTLPVKYSFCALIILSIIYANRKGIHFNWKIVLLLIYITIGSLMMAVLIDYPCSKTIQQFFLILVTYIFSANIVYYNKDRLSDFFSGFIISCYVLSIYIILMWFFNNIYVIGLAVSLKNIMREMVFSEASRISCTILGGLNYLLFSTKTQERVPQKMLILSSIIISNGSTAMLLSTIIFLVYICRTLIMNRTSIGIHLAIFGGTCLVVYIIFLSNDYILKDNIDRTVNMITSTATSFQSDSFDDLGEVNLSVMASKKNYLVAKKAPSRLFGTGLGTHTWNHDMIYGESIRDDNAYYYLNRMDAYSLLIRIFSEFGYVGVFLLFVLLAKSLNTKNLINTSCLWIIISYLLRGGHYTADGTILFFLLYSATSNHAQKEVLSSSPITRDCSTNKDVAFGQANRIA